MPPTEVFSFIIEYTPYYSLRFNTISKKPHNLINLPSIGLGQFNVNKGRDSN